MPYEWKRKVINLSLRAKATGKAHAWYPLGESPLEHIVPDGWVMSLCKQTEDPNCLITVNPDMEPHSALCKRCQQLTAGNS